MSRDSWKTIKDSKNFYVHTYRRAASFLVVSMGLNLLLGMSLYFMYFNKADPDFYATSGVTPPIELTPLDQPNYTAIALLASDPENEDDTKVIPQ
jgi:hypothetical protein